MSSVSSNSEFFHRFVHSLNIFLRLIPKEMSKNKNKMVTVRNRKFNITNFVLNVIVEQKKISDDTELIIMYFLP